MSVETVIWMQLHWRMPAVLTCLSVELLVGCSPKSLMPHGAFGTSDQAGGGNLINGKPIDFYAVDVTELPEYKQFIDPIDRDITRALGSGSRLMAESEGASYLGASALSKTWYVLPIPLVDLAPSAIGVAFATVQGGKQTEKEVFFGSDFSAQEAENRAKLILHETVMALYRMKFSDMKFYCSINANSATRRACIAAITENHSRPYFLPKSQTEFLTAPQYEAIRNASNWLWQHHATMTGAELILQLFGRGFDDRYFNPSAIRVSREEQNRTKLARSDLLLMLKSQSERARLPEFCGFDKAYPMISSRLCAVQFVDEGDALAISITDKKSGETKTFRMWLLHNITDLQLMPVTYRSGLSLFKVSLTLVDRPRGNSESGEDRFTLIGLLLAPSTGANYPSSSYEAVGIKIDQMVEREPHSYSAARLAGVDQAIHFIYSIESPPMYAEENDGW